MIWNFDFHSDVPLYMQVRNQVILSIASGELSVGDQLPTIRTLADESGINMMTISKAYQLLKAEGYVNTDRRSGTVVAEGKYSKEPSEQTLRQLRLIFAQLRLQGLQDSEILGLCTAQLKEA